MATAPQIVVGNFTLHHHRHTQPALGLARCRRKFMRFFPRGFQDPKYIQWERGYKWAAHEMWQETLNQGAHRGLLQSHQYEEVAARALRIEGKTNLLFSFEKMALRDAVRHQRGARLFATGLFNFLYGGGAITSRFERWCQVVGSLPRKQTRVLTWPAVTVFGFIAEPQTHFFLKPNVTRIAVARAGLTFNYESRPSGALYGEVLSMLAHLRRDIRDLKPRDMIDLQSFLWVIGSQEYQGG